MNARWHTIQVEEFIVRNEQADTQMRFYTFDEADEHLSAEREKHPDQQFTMLAVIDA